ncbi:MAG: hypothetical protein ACJAXZ_004632, partial [Akkermansiaceae bacterium]
DVETRHKILKIRFSEIKRIIFYVAH